jgi:hypothetical protein
MSPSSERVCAALGAPGGSASAGTDRTAPNPGGIVSAANGSHQVITCLACEEKIRTWRGDIRVELRLTGSRSGNQGRHD